ncbi:fumarate reductase [Ornithinimicrobium sp. CNJ-824]|uniref:FAD-binding protein n=1 Tax=Ornithinimicrobium sp. CNJ-824 TaxID=1904966 RepID=UPI0009632E49|nr:FAD-binding protein [Ornithinimicrobium sp. CNJ-824]OLT19524.1 fumarate reductase [Ornithinimicrobium sp. CNJ-824]
MDTTAPEDRGPRRHSYDVVVVGSGAAAFATAIGAADRGLTVLMLESTDKWGGSTAMSGGGLWMPDNPLMRRDGAGDSREEALTYLEATVGDEGRATSRERKEAFVDGVGDFVDLTERYGVQWARAKDYPDYYPELPGGKIGRGIEARPFDLDRIGDAAKTLRLLMALPLMTDDVWQIGRAWSTVGGMTRGVRVVGRILGGLVRGKKLAGIGAGLAASLYDVAVQQLGVELWLDSPVVDLEVEDGRVVGVVARRDGAEVRIGARRGVMLAAGGFDHNEDWRQKHHGIDGDPSGAPGNLGQVHALAARHGAALELMDDAWWGASVAPVGDHDPGFIVGERALPYTIMVDAQGRRFANEAESYVDLGHHMLEHDKDGAYWIISEARHARRYLRNYALDPRANKKLEEAGLLVKARTLAELADKAGFDPQVFREQVQRFNGFARSGVDGDFGKGNSAYDRYYGDPTVRPNPCLGAIEKGPFSAYRVVIGDLGTKGGVLTDEHARALREDGSVVEGLYAAGNVSASVMGRTYPGPGSTIAPASVFGLRGARHMAVAAEDLVASA